MTTQTQPLPKNSAPASAKKRASGTLVRIAGSLLLFLALLAVGFVPRLGRQLGPYLAADPARCKGLPAGHEDGLRLG